MTERSMRRSRARSSARSSRGGSSGSRSRSRSRTRTRTRRSSSESRTSGRGEKYIEDKINELDKRLTDITAFHISNAEDIDKTKTNVLKIINEIKRIHRILRDTNVGGEGGRSVVRESVVRESGGSEKGSGDQGEGGYLDMYS